MISTGDRHSEKVVSLNLVRSVAASADRDPTDLPPLADVVDPDALDALFSTADGDTPRDRGKVVFPYAGFRVTVWADGSVEVNPSDTEGT